MKDRDSRSATEEMDKSIGLPLMADLPKNKRATVLLGITGSIAAYKAVDLASRLRKRDFKVIAVMTCSARELVGPATLEAITGNPAAYELFPQVRPQTIEHISLSGAADVLAVVPATANFIAKAAHGLADDLLSTIALACRAPKLLAPAMNVNMWQNPVVQENLSRLRGRGWMVVEPEEGRLACGASGAGRLASLEKIENAILELISPKRPLSGIPILITAGRTEEPLDPVRYLSNRSSGKMGFALARVASRWGARVTLIAGASDIEPPEVHKLIKVHRAEEMNRAVQQELFKNRVLIMAAAVADYRPAAFSLEKIKKKDCRLTLPLLPTPDILAEAGRRSRGKVLLVGFALETSDLVKNALRKLKTKGLDLIVANDARAMGADENQGWLIDSAGTKQRLPRQDKESMAERILEQVARKLGRG